MFGINQIDFIHGGGGSGNFSAEYYHSLIDGLEVKESEGKVSLYKDLLAAYQADYDDYWEKDGRTYGYGTRQGAVIMFRGEMVLTDEQVENAAWKTYCSRHFQENAHSGVEHPIGNSTPLFFFGQKGGASGEGICCHRGRSEVGRNGGQRLVLALWVLLPPPPPQRTQGLRREQENGGEIWNGHESITEIHQRPDHA